MYLSIGSGSLGMFWSKTRLWGATGTYCACRYLGGTRGILSQRLGVECKLLLQISRNVFDYHFLFQLYTLSVRSIICKSRCHSSGREEREIQPMSMRHAPAPNQVRHCERQCGIQKKFVHSSRIAGDSSCPSPALLPSMPGRQ